LGGCGELGLSERSQPVQEWMKNISTELSRKKITLESMFADELTIKEYFELPEKQKDRLWKKWYKESEKRVKRIKAKDCDVE